MALVWIDVTSQLTKIGKVFVLTNANYGIAQYAFKWKFIHLVLSLIQGQSLLLFGVSTILCTGDNLKNMFMNFLMLFMYVGGG